MFTEEWVTVAANQRCCSQIWVVAEVVAEIAAEIAAEVLVELAAGGLGYRSQIWLVVPVVQAQ